MAVEPTSVNAPTTPRARTRRRSFEAREGRVAWAFLTPAAFLYATFIAGPFFAALALSLFDWNLFGSPKFIGLANYRHLVHDSEVRSTLVNTFVFSASSVVLHISLGLLLAVAINRAMPGWLRYTLRTLYVFPLLVSWAAVSLMWRYMLDPNFGIVNYYLSKLGTTPPNWLLSPSWALPALIGIDLWRTLGFTFIILLAGLQSIPSELYEAAQVDGARALTRFRTLTIPLLSPTLFFAVVITFIGAFQIFEPMFIITNGGPGTATRSLVQEVYLVSFRAFAPGYGSAISMILLLVVMAATALQFRLARLWVHYD
jgi:multiple sugar transport system permease protein